jgi:FKBP-type peptidyl-prolyl cis-trans isomerase
MLRLFTLLAGIFAVSVAFSTSSSSSSLRPHVVGSTTALLSDLKKNNDNHADDQRRDFIASSIAFLGAVGGVSASRAEGGAAPTKSTDGEGVTLYKTSSGLKYIELEPGRESALSPRYGQLCIFTYKAYVKLPNGKDKEEFDSYKSYVFKHGNGRTISGLDEGLHTMKPGGLRRIIIPPKLGFIQPGLGPFPQYPWDRRKLSSLLDKMVVQQGGNLVYDVRLEKVIDDEADQGYYEDAELSPEEMAELSEKLLKGRNIGVE